MAVTPSEACTHGPAGTCHLCTRTVTIDEEVFVRPEHYYDRCALPLTIRLCGDEEPLMVPIWLGSWWPSRREKRLATKASPLMSISNHRSHPPGWEVRNADQWGYPRGRPQAAGGGVAAAKARDKLGRYAQRGPENVRVRPRHYPGDRTFEKWVRLTDRHGYGREDPGVVVWHEVDATCLQHVVLCRAPNPEDATMWDLLTEEGHLEFQGSMLRGCATIQTGVWPDTPGDGHIDVVAPLRQCSIDPSQLPGMAKCPAGATPAAQPP